MALASGAAYGETALVLPFFNHAKSASLEWIGESIAENVKESLASDGMLVLDREERLEAYRRLSLRPGAELTHASVLKVGDSLGSSTVIYGFYELLPTESGNPGSKGSLRISARVLDLKRSRQVAAFSETGALEDLATLEAHLGWQMLTALHPKTTPPEREFMNARPSVRLDAVENYVRGLLATSAEQRHHFFTQAAHIDEHYSQPCFQLGKTYWEKKDYKVAAGWLERVGRAAPHYLEARFFLGLCRYLSGDLKGAEECFQEVSAELPLNEVYNNLGVAQTQRQDYAAAAASFGKALEGDDADPDFHFNLGVALWRGGKYSEAAEGFRAALARNSNDNEATALLGRCLKREPPRPGDTRAEGKPRLKTNYEENAFRQLQAELGKK
ncbi:MAG TPA: tetratricopeptide repeat protein [Candidatus Binataceae bacterium]|nr:tetratricopeptide repeat protein [Candidatus Binataceae bacterium]